MATMSVSRIRSLDPKRVIVLDTETTGTKPSSDEILSLTIIDLDGTVLFDELVRPERRKRWPKAQEVNGITPAMVADRKTLAEHGDFLRELWKNVDLVVGYNVSFDTGFLYASGLSLSQHVPEYDVMREFAPIWGKWDDYHEDWRWAKLADCAKYYDIGDFDAHTSLGDTEATRRCFLALLDDKERRNEEYDKEQAERAKNRKSVAMQSNSDGNSGCMGAIVLYALIFLLAVVIAVIIFT